MPGGEPTTRVKGELRIKNNGATTWNEHEQEVFFLKKHNRVETKFRRRRSEATAKRWHLTDFLNLPRRLDSRREQRGNGAGCGESQVLRAKGIAYEADSVGGGRF